MWRHHHLICVPYLGLDWLELLGLSLITGIKLKLRSVEHRLDWLSISRLVCWLALLVCWLKANYWRVLWLKWIRLLLWLKGLKLGYGLLRLCKLELRRIYICVLNGKLKFVNLGWRSWLDAWLHSSKSVIKLKTRHLYLHTLISKPRRNILLRHLVYSYITYALPIFSCVFFSNQLLSCFLYNWLILRVKRLSYRSLSAC